MFIVGIGVFKRLTVLHRALPAWARLPEGAEQPPTKVGHIELWLSRQLNRVPWHKVAVMFTVERDGVIAIHTHGEGRKQGLCSTLAAVCQLF